MHAPVAFRPAEPGDMAPAYAVFRRSIYDYLYRVGFVDEAAAKDPPIETSWKRQGPWIEHLWATAAENWVALDAGGKIVGWAMSVMRSGHLELTMFFVEPGVQSGGIGRGLIERAFPNGSGPSGRSIVATQDARALGLYLRSGVAFQTSSVDVLLRAGPSAAPAGLTFERLKADAAGVDAIGAVEAQILGFRRDPDIAHLLSVRPAWLALRNGRAVGYAFGIQPNPPGADDFEPTAGPMAALDPADVPALIDQVAVEGREGEEFFVTLPLVNRVAMDHVLMTRGGRIDPFYLMILCSHDGVQFDRYVHTSPSFIL